MTIRGLIELIDRRFRSANAVPVARAPIKAEEWAAIREALEQIYGDVPQPTDNG